ncbi:hypothetical protein G6F31_016961 [Rhizopus arrhizus]|nr:hypothetical protein G6F31_016961 [Rhizopus arrhizus]
MTAAPPTPGWRRRWASPSRSATSPCSPKTRPNAPAKSAASNLGAAAYDRRHSLGLAGLLAGHPRPPAGHGHRALRHPGRMPRRAGCLPVRHPHRLHLHAQPADPRRRRAHPGEPPAMNAPALLPRNELVLPVACAG